MDSHRETLLEFSSTSHPGETVMDYLDFHEWSQRELARRTGLTPKTISEICNKKAPISPNTALALEKVFGRPAHFWLNLQMFFSEAVARKSELSKASDWSHWVQRFPLQEMRRLRFSLPSGRSDADVLLSFFGVSSPDSWRSVWDRASVTYRQTQKFRAREEAIAAWVRETELIARGLDVAPFDEYRLLSSIEDLRLLTRMSADKVMDPVQRICATAGVAVVWVPALRQTGISGCARWIGDNRALIGLTLRYKTDDQMWFTFFHEVAHVLLHRQKHYFIIDNADTDLSDSVVDPEMQGLEEEANQFAAETLIPSEMFSEFVRKKLFTNDSIHKFAETLGVGPGIIVGRLQHEGLLAWHEGNALKQRLDWELADEA